MRFSRAVLLLLLLAGAADASAQAGRYPQFDGWTEARFLGWNALVGGVTAGLVAGVRGDPLVPALVAGAGGGALIYAGKRIAVDMSPGAGFLGRQVASVGGSMVGNAVAGRGGLDRVAFAFGPVRAYIGSEVAGVDWRLDVPAAAAAAWGLARGASLDVAESLSSGAVVLRGDGEFALPGTIFYRSARPERVSYVLAHEKVHILQYDQSFLSWGDPIEGWLARRYPSLRGPLGYLDFNLAPLALAAVLGFYVWEDHDDQWWEREAIYLGRARSGAAPTGSYWF